MISAKRELRRLSQALEAVRSGPSLNPTHPAPSLIDAVHDVRVCCRRLDVFLRLGGHHVLRDDLRWLRASLGPLRDLDVIRSFGVSMNAATTRFLSTERRRLAAEARTLVRHPRTAALLRALAHLAPVSPKQARRAMARLAKKLEASKRAPTFAGLHDERRAVRRLRFAKEWVGLDATELRERQVVLGVPCDLDALRRFALSRGAREASLLLSRAEARLVALINRHRDDRPDSVPRTRRRG